MHESAPATITADRKKSVSGPTPHALDERDTSRYLGFSRSWLRQQRSQRTGPPYLRVGRTIRYRLTDLEAWLDQHRVDYAAGR